MTGQVKFSINKPRLILMGLVALLAIGAAIFFVNTFVVKKDDLALSKPMNLLFIGMDVNIGEPYGHDKLNEPSRTDTLILAILDTYNHKVSLVSVPRDSLVHIPGYGVERINASMAYGGIDLTKRMVTRLTGYRVDHYMLVNFVTFKKIVDLIGGVEVNVDKNMRYGNEYGVLTINLNKGPQVLNGEKSLQYVRFRNEELGDISRVERQRTFLMALFKKLKEPVNILRVPQFIDIAKKYTKTDLTAKEIIRLANFARGLTPGKDLSSYTLPGHFEGPYWRPEKEAVTTLMTSLKPVKKVEADK